MVTDARLQAFVTPSWTGDTAKALWYGQFVAAAIAMGDGPPPTKLPPSPTLPSGYEIVADIYMTDFALFGPDASQTHYGLLAADAEGHYVLAVRGTHGRTEWWDDVTSLRLVDCVFRSSPTSFGEVGYGFLAIYNTMTPISRKHQTEADRQVALDVQRPKGFAAALGDIIKDHAATRATALAAAPPPTVDAVGHSLGSALVTLYTLDQHTGPDNFAVDRLCTFASPMVGNAAFHDNFQTRFIMGDDQRSWRFFIRSDLVPMVPPAVLGFEHIDGGIELKLAWGTRWWWWLCSHNLDSYLHVLDPSLPLPAACTGSTC